MARLLKVAYWLLIGKIKKAENQMINSLLSYPDPRQRCKKEVLSLTAKTNTISKL